ncbi:hypothetical protein J1N35_040116, partial [Gossypium stocksii]
MKNTKVCLRKSVSLHLWSLAQRCIMGYSRQCKTQIVIGFIVSSRLICLELVCTSKKDDNTRWIDTGATKHVCKEKSVFTKFIQCENDNVLYMGNSSTAAIKDKWSIELQFTSGKVLTLND